MNIPILLQDAIDFEHWDGWRERVTEYVELARAATPASAIEFRSVSGGTLAEDGVECWELESWRRFVASALIADWATYERVTDQADLVRLLFVMSRFPAGFRVWFARGPEKWSPVGYTAWYPFEETYFARMESGVPSLLDRMVVPLRTLEASRFLYLFNFSIVSGLRGTEYARLLMRSFVDELRTANPSGLAAIAVSSDGVRISERFGMRQTGQFLLDGDKELILTGRGASIRLTLVP